MGAFPQYSRNGFALSTESYGGHYGPIFSEYFETQNAKNITGAHQISLETVLIGYASQLPIYTKLIVIEMAGTIQYFSIKPTTTLQFTQATHMIMIRTMPVSKHCCTIIFTDLETA